MYFFTNLLIPPAFEPASPSVQGLFREEYVMTKRRERNARHQEALALRADAKLISFEAAARDARVVDHELPSGWNELHDARVSQRRSR